MQTSYLSLHNINAITAAIATYDFEISIPQPTQVQSDWLRW